MSTITPHDRSVRELLPSQAFAIDGYQREYKWEEENIDELLTDLRDKFHGSYKDGDETKKVGSYEDHPLGSTVAGKRNGENYLAGGQQRVTSSTLLLIYLRRVAEERGLTVVGTLAPLIYSDRLGEPKFDPDVVERPPVIEALFKGVPFDPTGCEESVQTMFARLGDIEAMDLSGKLAESLPHFSYWLMEEVGLIEIANDNDNYAYAIFETMNDRGKPLSLVDMLQAYLLSQGYSLIQGGGDREPGRLGRGVRPSSP